MSTLPTVSIGIPAYNEEANIQELLKALLQQQEEDFRLQKILVVSDGSYDNTAEKVRQVRDPRVILVDHAERKGRSDRRNELLEFFSSEDILVFLDADILPENPAFLRHLIKPLLNAENNIGLVSSRGVPLPANTLMEKMVNFSVAMKQEIFEDFKNGDNVYVCHGYSRAFSRKFADSFSWEFFPNAEDAFSYFRCKELGFAFRYQPNAQVLYRSPTNRQDHFSQSIRFFLGKKKLSERFGQENIRKAYAIPISLKVKKAGKYFFKNPFLWTGYLGILLWAKALSLRKQDPGALWKNADSSKNLVTPKEHGRK